MSDQAEYYDELWLDHMMNHPSGQPDEGCPYCQEYFEDEGDEDDQDV